MIRLKDIAERAGVSVMTVSKVLRDAPDISPATKARVRSLAQQMGYVPNSMAQSLRTRTTKLLGLVVPAMTDPTIARVVMALEERACELGYDLLLSQTLHQAEREEACIRRLLARRIDGLFVTPVWRLEAKAPIYDELRQRNIPTVVLGHLRPFCQGFVNVETDDVQASTNLTRHLLGLGHRRIAYLAGPAAAPAAQERFEGYRRALQESGITVDDRLVFSAGTTIEEGEKAARQMINESAHATAVQAVNDLVAIGAANVFASQGISIPTALSLVGFGNVMTSQFFRVPLTTAGQPKFRLGAAAMESMLRVLRGEHPETTRLSAELIVRQSTAAPPPAKSP
ncbi:MAG: LacI family transcriptional regulator [Verrucomicrobia bacterium]|nr:LacI family transcriptional regulator [Verrucomicrobiota bacterium]